MTSTLTLPAAANATETTSVSYPALSTTAQPEQQASVNPAFTPRPRRRRAPRYRETPAYVAMVRRMVRGLGKRVADMDVASLPELASLSKAVDDVLRDTVTQLHDRGYSWNDIARELGVTRQAAYQRFGR